MQKLEWILQDGSDGAASSILQQNLRKIDLTKDGENWKKVFVNF